MHPFRKFSLGLTAACLLTAGPAMATSTGINVQPVVRVEGQMEVWLDAGLEAWSGENTYQVGYPVGYDLGGPTRGQFPFREMVVPVDATFASAHLFGIFHDKWLVNAGLKRNISEPDDNVTDSYFLTESNPSQLDLYSESDIVDFDALIIDVDLSHKLTEGLWGWLAGGVGFMYQRFHYDYALISQYSPSGAYSDYSGIGTGYTDGKYEITYYMPYLLASAHFTPTNRFAWDARLGVAPWIKGEDRAQYLPDVNEDTGAVDGWGVNASLAAQYDVTNHWFARAGVNYTFLEADGDTDVFVHNTYQYTTGEETESSQLSGYLGAGYRFGPFPKCNDSKYETP